MAQVDTSDINAILSAVTDMSSPITDYAVHTNKSSNILQHNMRISADTNSPIASDVLCFLILSAAILFILIARKAHKEVKSLRNLKD